MNQLLSLSQALEQMLTALPSYSSPQSETISLEQAQNRICAEDIFSPINVPGFDNSAMDGYAIRLADLQAAEAEDNRLGVIGKSFAGSPFNGEWKPQSAVRIMTGAVIPQGCDAVIMQEQVEIDSDGNIKCPAWASIKSGQNIRRIGEDVKVGDVVLKQGAKLTALSLPLLASLGIEKVQVFKKLKVALISTGDELVAVGQPLQSGQIYDTNRFAVKLMLQQWNCEILDYGILPDDPILFEQKFMLAQQQADLLITSGGVSVGEADFTKTVLEKLGEINFWKLAIKPGKPFAFGKLEKAWFCGLPGNPVSALVTFYQLVQPVLAKLSGFSEWKKPIQLNAVTTGPLKKAVGRLDFQRGFYSVTADGKIEVRSVGFQGSHMFSSFVESNCFIVLEQQRGNVVVGETVTIEPFAAVLS